jgi:hypothetical protein
VHRILRPRIAQPNPDLHSPLLTATIRRSS